MIKYKYFIVSLILSSIVLISSIVSAQINDQVSINAMVCDACNQSTVVLKSEYRYSSSSYESDLAGSSYKYCNYCHTTEKFNHYDIYERAYDRFFNWHECINCGWHSDGYYSKKQTSSTYVRDYDKCSVCGMEG